MTKYGKLLLDKELKANDWRIVKQLTKQTIHAWSALFIINKLNEHKNLPIDNLSIL